MTALTTPLDTKTREFQFKFLHDILVNNFWLKKWNLAETDNCTFCKDAREDIIHLFWDCEHVQTFWNYFNVIYGRAIGETVNISTVVYSSKDPLFCTLILLGKLHIYESRYKEGKPDIRIYRRKVNYIQNTEFEIAKKNNTIIVFPDSI